MPKQNKQGRSKDANRFAQKLVELSTIGEKGSITPPTKAQVSWLMAELGRKGGEKGGKRRLETMTPKERSAAARKAAQARWHRR